MPGVSRVERAKRLMLGPYGAPLRLAHRATVRSQLGAVAALDRLKVRRDREQDDWLAERLTVTAKTFLRPATARRFVRTTRRTFTGRIVLADDSPVPVVAPDDGPRFWGCRSTLGWPWAATPPSGPSRRRT